jgi:DNA topoisomerase-2
MSKKSNETKQKYSKMDPIEHILHRSDMYVGSTRPREIEDYVASLPDFKITKKNIQYSPAILRIFVEPLSNAIDNFTRSLNSKTPSTQIKVNINKETGETSIWNDGNIIPIEENTVEKCYNHSLIFGQLLTGSNYDDEEERLVSGRNGLGSKTANIFSSFFSVKGLDPENKKTFYQEWTQNMKLTFPPVIEKTKLKKGYTEVSWIPDFKQFGISGYSQDIIDLYCKYVVDTAMLTGINVYFNDVLIPVKNLKEYSKLYSEEETKDLLYINNPDSQVVIIPSHSYQYISFVNGVYTALGGTHMDAWTEAAFRPIVQKLTKPKGSTYTIGDVKKFFKVFVSVKVVNPEFESQNKNKLESPVTACIKTKEVNTILKWSIIDDIKRSKEFGVLKKLERKKKNFVKIDGLDPANNEGGKHSTDCTLILVEGLSAKTYAVQGIEVGAFGKKGRDWFGVYALRGKVLNVRNAKPASIAKNAVVTDIIKAIGLRTDVDYKQDEPFNTLRYGKVMIITDADVDGIHIKGLLLNMFHV